MKTERNRRFLLRLGVLLAVFVLLVLWVIKGWPCLFKSLLHIPCLTCGMSRAWLAALRMDLWAAFGYHPMFWSIPVLALLWLFMDRIPRRWVVGTATAVLVGFLVCYVIGFVTL